MTTQAYWNWRTAGSPWSPATCIADFRTTMQKHGYTVYVLGADDASHLRSDFPEDHCPFSGTPWPGRQPYPRVLALDIMPGGAMDWRALGEKIHADKLAGVPGTEWIKYMNYTDRAGNCWHASWQGGYARRSSNDGGHIHISGRTDHVDAHTAYDPFVGAPAPAPTPTPQPATGSGWTRRIIMELPQIARGAKGTYVRRLQGLLVADGYSIGAAGIDGDFGAGTAGGLARFQADKRVPQSVRSDGRGDGVCGDHTWSFLLLDRTVV